MWPFNKAEPNCTFGERMSDMIMLADKRLGKQMQETDEKVFAILDALKCRIESIENKLKEKD